MLARLRLSRVGLPQHQTPSLCSRISLPRQQVSIRAVNAPRPPDLMDGSLRLRRPSGPLTRTGYKVGRLFPCEELYSSSTHPTPLAQPAPPLYSGVLGKEMRSGRSSAVPWLAGASGSARCVLPAIRLSSTASAGLPCTE